MEATLNNLNFDLGPADLLYLGDPNVVGQVVNDHINGVFDAYKRFQHGQITRTEAIAAIDALAIPSGDIIAGRNPAYHLAPWQARGDLRGKILTAQWLPAATGDQTAEEVFFRKISDVALHHAMELDSGTSVEQVGKELQVDIRTFVNFILGI